MRIYLLSNLKIQTTKETPEEDFEMCTSNKP